MKKLLTLFSAIILLGSCATTVTSFGTVKENLDGAVIKNWEYLGMSDTCYYFIVPGLNWEVEFCSADNTQVDIIIYHVPKDQGLQFYIYLDADDYECELNECVNNKYAFTFFEEEDEFIVIETIK